jgi:hypothetical protein
LASISKAKAGSSELEQTLFKNRKLHNHMGRHQYTISMNDRSSKQENQYWYILAQNYHHSTGFNSSLHFNQVKCIYGSQYHMDYLKRQAIFSVMKLA